MDIDFEKFFDTVDHDVLMSRVARRVKDKGLLRLIGRYLRCRRDGRRKAEPDGQGVPQGGPLSPMLSNILLDDFDKELEKRVIGSHAMPMTDHSGKSERASLA